MTPYRSECSRCAELAADVDALKSANASLAKPRWRDSMRFVGIVCGALALSTIFGFATHACIMAPPRPPGPCVDSAMISAGSTHECMPGATLTTEQIQGSTNVLMHCRCAKTPADAGAE